MAHVGEELGFRSIGCFGAFFFRLIKRVGVGELGLLTLQLVAGGRQVTDGRHQTFFRIAQAFFMALEKRDVGADGHQTAVTGASLVDLQPAGIGQLDFHCA